MKKWMFLLLVLLFVPACSYASYSYVTSSDEFGNYCSLFGASYSVYPETFPYCFTYEGKEVAIDKADFYQHKFDHGFYPFFHVSIDVSNLTDEEIHSLREENFYLEVSFMNDRIYDYKFCSPLVDLYSANLKTIDVIYFSEHVSSHTLVGYDCCAVMTIKHPKGSKVIFDSKNVTVYDSQFTFKQTKYTPGSLYVLDKYLLTQIFSALEK